MPSIETLTTWPPLCACPKLACRHGSWAVTTGAAIPTPIAAGDCLQGALRAQGRWKLMRVAQVAAADRISGGISRRVILGRRKIQRPRFNSDASNTVPLPGAATVLGGVRLSWGVVHQTGDLGRLVCRIRARVNRRDTFWVARRGGNTPHVPHLGPAIETRAFCFFSGASRRSC